MTKRFLIILVAGLLWGNVGFAEVLNYVCQYKAADKKINIQLNLEKNQIKHGNKIEEIVVKNLTQVVFLKSGTFPNYRVFTYAPHDSASLQQIGVGIRDVELIKEKLRKGELRLTHFPKPASAKSYRVWVTQRWKISFDVSVTK